MVVTLSLESTSSSSYSSAGTSSSPSSSSLGSSALDIACHPEAETSVGIFSFSLGCTVGDEDRERGKEERDGEVTGEGILLELATGTVVGLNKQIRWCDLTYRAEQGECWDLLHRQNLKFSAS